MKPIRVFFYVQHLWGVGHVYRATRIAQALVQAGMETHLVWGGTQIPGFDFSGMHFHPLTPVRTEDASFSTLLHGDGRVFTEDDKDKRKGELLALFDTVKPDILITEAYPFGRRQMRFELRPLMEHAKSRSAPPLIVSSIRDIMTEDRKEKRVEESCKLVKDYFDLVLVHGDETLIPVEATLQGAERFADKIRYTGLVTPQPTDEQIPDGLKCDILVSAGGGAFGKNLLLTALDAARAQANPDEKWLVIAGSEMLEPDFQELIAKTPENIQLIRHVPNLLVVMNNCRVSVSHAGYNTVADILRAGCASVLYPYTGGRETEQLRRAEMMGKLGIAEFLAPNELSPGILLAAIGRAGQNPSAKHSLKIDGAEGTAKILREAVESRAL